MRTVCGLDIHKDSIFMCIVDEQGKKSEGKFGVSTREIRSLSMTLKSHYVSEVCMESTGIYWKPVWHLSAPEQDQGDLRKWKWNPLSWGKPEEVVFHFGSNTDGSGMYGGVSSGKSGQSQPMIGYSMLAAHIILGHWISLILIRLSWDIPQVLKVILKL